jgi:phosphoheptose isomerase
MQKLFLAQIEQGQEVKKHCIEHLPDILARAAEIIIGSLQMGGKLLTCGNGGSAGDAQHIASELVNRFETERMALGAIALVPDSSVVTAIANDYSYEVLFSRQVEALGRPGDVLLAFSTSGNSKNVVQAIHAAHARGMRVVAFTGKDGGFIGKILSKFDAEVRVPAQDTARIQEIHLLGIHSVCKAIDLHFSGKSFCLPGKVQLDWQALAQLIRGLQPLVFTNGVFDLLHRGHIHSLQRARQEGAYLVVGINSDTSVKRLGKGSDRPIQNQNDRAEILAALSCVDFVTIFDEDTPEDLIKTLNPDVLVKGGDYSIESIVGADFVTQNGGRVVTIPFEHDRSTSKTIQKIRA